MTRLNGTTAILLAGTISMLLVACGGDGGGTAEEERVIPTVGIVVDGSVGDWGQTEPMLLDKSARVDLSTTGGDLHAVYLAKSGGRLYVRFDIYTDEVSTDNIYRIWFDNNMDNSLDGEINDRQLEVSYYNGRWRAVVQTMEEPYKGDLGEDGPAVVSGSIIEASVDLGVLALSESFIFTAIIRDENYDDIDEQRGGIVVRSR